LFLCPRSILRKRHRQRCQIHWKMSRTTSMSSAAKLLSRFSRHGLGKRRDWAELSMIVRRLSPESGLTSRVVLVNVAKGLDPQRPMDR
jgi:hypothetical protein